jgi:Chaperone of endosialidase
MISVYLKEMKYLIFILLFVPLFSRAQIFVRPNLTAFVGEDIYLADTILKAKFTTYALNRKLTMYARGKIDSMQFESGPYMNFYSSYDGSNAIQNANTQFKARTTMQNDLSSKQGFFNNAIYNSVQEVPGLVNGQYSSGMANDMNFILNKACGITNFSNFNNSSVEINGIRNAIQKNDSLNTGVINGLYNEFTINHKGDVKGINNEITIASDAQGKIYGVYSSMLRGGTPSPKKAAHKVVAIYGAIDTSQSYGTQEVYAGEFIGKVKVQGPVLATAFSLTSDEKLKEDVKEFSGGIDLVKKFVPKSYLLKNELKEVEKKRHIGFIAQDIEKIMPELVTTIKISKPERYKIVDSEQQYIATEKNANGERVLVDKKIKTKKYEKIADEETDDVKSVSYIELIPVLLQAIKEQQVTIEQLQKDVDKLKIKVGN